MSEPTDYKSTLNLPKTDFPMKADLPKREPLFLEQWKKLDIYSTILKKQEGKPKYILHDGPPYANGDIHIGHALNKTLKDIIVKYKTMRGFSAAYVPGWDCHGLPVEHALFKELKISKYQIGQVEFRKKAHDYALRFVDTQRQQFIRLGVFADWQNPYLTLTPDYEEGIITSLATLVEKGYIYRGLKPVNWCCKCETALAEAEVEYEDHTSPSIFVAFRYEDNVLLGKNGAFVIWTTTPWTLIANVAVAVHPQFTYCLVKTEKGDFVVAKDLLDRVVEHAKFSSVQVLKTFSGKELEGIVYTHPFGLRKGKVVCADYVSREDGSGLVHTAPGHGAEDYQTGLRYELEIVMPVDGKGVFDQTAGEFSGQNIFDAHKAILEKLQSIGALLWAGTLQHSYPHCWRCKKPVIFRATKQWFLKIDHDGLRQKLLKTIHEDVAWVPETGRERISAMVELRPDWCLSRQRYWGVPIPSLVCTECHEETLDVAVIKKFAAFTQHEGSDAWFLHDSKDFIPAGFACPHCKGTTFTKGADILDVWFDSGVSSQSVLKKRVALQFPADLYLEGSDQHRGWFQSSIIPAMCIDGKAPFKTVLTHGFVVDGDGRKMSKSMGNVISPHDIIKNSGADILRLWVASSGYNEDIRISTGIVTQLSDAYRKIRNTIRFILSNLYDFNPDIDKVSYDGLKKLDKAILAEMEDCLAAVTESYEKFDFHAAFGQLHNFCNSNMSEFYLDRIKGRLYAGEYKERRAAQTAIYEIMHVLVRIMAPILAFTADEIWANMPKEKSEESVASVHLLDWPHKNSLFAQKAVTEELHAAMQLIPDVNKALEEKRTAGLIGSSFDAQINLLTNNDIRYKYLTGLQDDLTEIFKVSQVAVTKQHSSGTDVVVASGISDVTIQVAKAVGEKCVRCWNYADTVGKNVQHPQVCGKCLSALGR